MRNRKRFETTEVDRIFVFLFGFVGFFVFLAITISPAGFQLTSFLGIVLPAVILCVPLIFIFKYFSRHKRKRRLIQEMGDIPMKHRSGYVFSDEKIEFVVNHSRRAPYDYGKILECIENAHESGDGELVILALQNYFSMHSKRDISPHLLAYGIETSLRLHHPVTAFNALLKLISIYEHQHSTERDLSGYYDAVCLLGLLRFHFLCDPRRCPPIA